MKRLLQGLLAVLVVAGLFLAGAGETSPVTFTVTAVGEAGVGLEGVRLFLYGYNCGGRNLLGGGWTDPAGALAFSVSRPFLLSDPQDARYYDLVLHAHHPRAGLGVATWSASTDELLSGEETPIYLRVECHPGAGLTPSASGARGRWREVCTAADYFIDDVVIGEIHVLAGLETVISYGPTTASKIEAAYRQVRPETGPWRSAGFTLRSTSGESSWSSVGAGCSRKLETQFKFARETWELQELDGEHPDVWRPIHRWEEVRAIRHEGGASWAGPVSTAREGRPHDQVQAGRYGNWKRVEPGRVTSVTCAAPTEYPAGWVFEGHNFSSWGNYEGGATLSWQAVAPGREFLVYDYDSLGKTWYCTSR